MYMHIVYIFFVFTSLRQLALSKTYAVCAPNYVAKYYINCLYSSIEESLFVILVPIGIP